MSNDDWRKRVRRAVSVLEALPTTGAIAEELLREGAYGEPGSAFSCPVAKYLVKASGLDRVCVWVGAGNQVKVWEGSQIAKGMPSMRLSMSTPLISQFICQFDNEEIPVLIQKDERFYA